MHACMLCARALHTVIGSSYSKCQPEHEHGHAMQHMVAHQFCMRPATRAWLATHI